MTEDILLRDLNKTDARDLSLIFSDPSIKDNLCREVLLPYTINNARVFIGMSNISCNYISKAVEYQGSLVGLITLYPQENLFKYNAEILFLVAKEHRNKGIMSVALRKMLSYTFDNFLFERIFSNVLESNLTSIRILTKSGFKREGILRNSICMGGKFLNNCIFSILRSEFKLANDLA
ncbi:MAG: GNAT family protein [Bacteroidales bacterium]|nr:GNAT family protein [Bacteroidales bacterium]